jgi:hypothetical protein
MKTKRLADEIAKEFTMKEFMSIRAANSLVVLSVLLLVQFAIKSTPARADGREYVSGEAWATPDGRCADNDWHVRELKGMKLFICKYLGPYPDGTEPYKGIDVLKSSACCPADYPFFAAFPGGWSGGVHCHTTEEGAENDCQVQDKHASEKFCSVVKCAPPSGPPVTFH